MRGRGHGRRAMVVTAAVLAVVLLGASAHADPGTPAAPGQGDLGRGDTADPHTIYHEAVHTGNDRIIQAPRPAGVVEQQSLWANGTPSFYGRP